MTGRRPAGDYNGILNIRKEAGCTSFDVVARLRGICGQRKIGHTGTLDPAATGVLPVCLGKATKVAGLLTDWDKEYVAELLLGCETDTLDSSGCVLQRADAETLADLTEEAVREAILSFRGGYEQIPPMYSAKKVDGRRLYDLARSGETIERKAVRVRIPELEILELSLGAERPHARFRVVCSKGTYIRSLCADIGARLGCGGCMDSLVRTRVGPFSLENALTLAEVEAARDAGSAEGTDGIAPLLRSVEDLFVQLPPRTVTADGAHYLRNGNKLRPEQLLPGAKPGTGLAPRIRVRFPDGAFAGLYRYDEAEGLYRPEKVFL